jgi:hypothetical protein
MKDWISVAPRTRLGLRTFLFLLFVAVLPSRGSVILFSNKAAWLSATTVSGTIDFEGIAPGGGTSDFSTAAGLTLDGVNFLGQTERIDCTIPGGCSPIGSGYQLFVSSPGGFDGLDWGSGGFLVGPLNFVEPVSPFLLEVQVGTLTAQFPAGTTSIGFDLMSIGELGANPAVPHICLSTGDCFDISTPTYPGHTFAGFTSSAAIDSVVLTMPDVFPNGTVFLDNVEQGTAIPEPRGLSLLGLTLLLTLARPLREHN